MLVALVAERSPDSARTAGQETEATRRDRSSGICALAPAPLGENCVSGCQLHLSSEWLMCASASEVLGRDLKIYGPYLGQEV